eukprot:385-Eustigmatos_ZCMA.PRE.1
MSRTMFAYFDHPDGRQIKQAGYTDALLSSGAFQRSRCAHIVAELFDSAIFSTLISCSAFLILLITASYACVDAASHGALLSQLCACVE